ncbi:MAG: pyridoxal phosphate-dependent aminotransferase [Gemmatimonadales bacterium]|nr:MAG: pyridoxal phosphate-dependent aminotransferase [Gemmatimonadales bacterium]
MNFSSNIADLRPSATIAVSTLAKKLRAEGRDIIDLSAGEPDFPTPGWICDAAVEGIRAGRTRYTPAPGIPELRSAVVGSMLRGGRGEGWALSPDQVVVTCGAKQALYNACTALFGPGDEVMVATPYWTSYPQIVSLARAKSAFVSGPAENGFKLTPEILEAERTEATRGLILCSPSNPVGSVYSLEELRAVARWARDHEVHLISDEIYRRIYFGDPGESAPGLLDLDVDDVGSYVVVDGVSKAYAMTGWRIGFALAPVEIAGKLSALQSHSTSNAATPSQVAALRALDDGDRSDAEIGSMVEAFRRRRDLVLSRFAERLSDLDMIAPEGAFYLFIRVDGDYGGDIRDSQGWCSSVLESVGVALVPGAAFGDDRYVRLSYATSDDLLEEAIRRVQTHRAGSA